MKKFALYIGSWLILLAIIFGASFALMETYGPPDYEVITRYESQPRVYVTNYGDCYHSGDCHYLHSSKIATGLNKARQEGYYACSYCGGIAYGTIEVPYYERVEIDPTPRNVSDSLIAAVFVSLIPAMLFAHWLCKKLWPEVVPFEGEVDSSEERRAATIARYREYTSERLAKAHGMRIHHDEYGDGTIVSADNYSISVVFDSGVETEPIPFPECMLDGYVTFYKNDD